MGLRDDGSLYAWGDNSRGQVGAFHEPGLFSFPKQVWYTTHNGPLKGTKWTQIACGYYHSIGLRDSGHLYAWGDNTQGQFGIGSVYSSANLPVLVLENNWISCSAGAYHTTGVKNDGNVYNWGLNTNGQLGLGNIISPKSSPIEVSGNLLNPIFNI